MRSAPKLLRPVMDGTDIAPALTLSDWLDRELPEPDRLLGDWLTTTTRALIVGPTGLGKTMFGLAVAFAITTAKNFLHWTAGRRARALYIDGEMSRRSLKRRLIGEVDRAGEIPEGLIILSKEDFEDMPPLNIDAGQKWMDTFITTHGPFDVIIFDNIQALLVGDMKDEEQWAKVLPWVRSLTRRTIGQIWLHHTGHDESKSYGSKAREWQMDIVILMERVESPEADLSFAIKFTKARERSPENRADFEPVTMSLKDDKWTQGQVVSAAANKFSANEKTMLSLLDDAKPNGLTLNEWNSKARELGIGEKRRSTLYDLHKKLRDKKLVHTHMDRWHIT